MTYHTDTERAEFIQWCVNDGCTGDEMMAAHIWDNNYSEARAWEAARRAPVAPVPQKGWRYVPEVLTPEMKREFMDMLMDGIDIYMNSNEQIEIQTDAPRRIWKSILAAAPQPPEANPVELHQIKNAAPVQMPTPVGKVEDGGLKWHIPDRVYSLPVRYLQGTHKLYTEHQVLQLLATHGIK